MNSLADWTAANAKAIAAYRRQPSIDWCEWGDIGRHRAPCTNEGLLLLMQDKEGAYIWLCCGHRTQLINRLRECAAWEAMAS